MKINKVYLILLILLVAILASGCNPLVDILGERDSYPQKNPMTEER